MFYFEFISMFSILRYKFLYHRHLLLLALCTTFVLFLFSFLFLLLCLMKVDVLRRKLSQSFDEEKSKDLKSKVGVHVPCECMHNCHGNRQQYRLITILHACPMNDICSMFMHNVHVQCALQCACTMYINCFLYTDSSQSQ